jgi:hypothetical protein
LLWVGAASATAQAAQFLAKTSTAAGRAATIEWLERAISDGDAASCYFSIVVDLPTPMGLPARLMSPATRAAYIQRLGLPVA